MSEASSVGAFLSHAKEREEAYDWLGAVELYKTALGSMLVTDYLKRGQIQERIGYALYRAAMQAESTDQFKERMLEASAGYKRAKEFYNKLGEPEKAPWMLRCDAMTAWLNYWLSSNAPEKKKSLDECWNLTKESLKAFERAGDMLEYGKTYNQLSSSAFLDHRLTWDFQAREKVIREALEHGERTITSFSDSGNAHELAKTHVTTAKYLTIIGETFIPDMDEKERYFKKGLERFQKATELSEETAFLELLSFSDPLLWSLDDLLVQYDKALGYAKRTKDKYLVGTALDALTYATRWKCRGIEDPDKRLKSLQKALKYAEDTKHQFSSISFASPRGHLFWVGSAIAEYHWALAEWETDLSRKRDLLEKALMEATHAFKQARNTGYPEITRYGHHMVSMTLVSLAEIETDLKVKKKRLEEALEHRKEYLSILEPHSVFHYWNLGFGWTGLADLKAELSTFEKDVDNRRSMLEEAASLMERALQLRSKHISLSEKLGDLEVLATLGLSQYAYGVLLNRLYELSNKVEHQRRAINAFEEATESYQKSSMVGRMAECTWKAATSCDRLGEHLKAMEYFNMASNHYSSAAEKIPQLKDFYQDHALYMQAWSEIEKARHHQERQEYGSAEEHFEKAADLHKALKQWSYLTPNYSAWVNMEKAEDLSRREHSEEALRTFEQAAKLFIETKKSLERKLGEIEDLDEKTMATNLIKASDIRREYCLGRTALEEARILDKQGDHYSSSLKFGSAAQTFEKIAEALESEQDRKELKLITILSRAWRKMTQAEIEASPSLYVEASQLFEEAKELSPNEREKMLALGHSRFCRALEAGTRFADTRDVALHAAAQQSLESAANYYIKAGFQNASEYVRGTELLFDAYVYMGNAKTEIAPEKKAKLYMMAEKVLKSSADSFMKAEHPEKREQVLRLLGKVKKERELALSLNEVLHAPLTVSTTASFTAPTSTYENAVGLERFEHACIQAHLATSEEALLGEEFEIRLDLVNVGKESALLVSVDELVPSTFKITEAPPSYNIEDHTIDVKGRRLGPQKVESIRISAKATKTGVSTLCPQITYVDELGRFHTHKPEAVQNTILPAGFQFKTNNAQKMFEYLTKAFVEDYMKRRLALDKSGWRTLMQIARNARISRSSIYGTTTRRGPATAELEGRGVIEIRIFPQERGRGGRITKARIAYEKDIIKRYIDEQVMKIKEK